MRLQLVIVVGLLGGAQRAGAESPVEEFITDAKELLVVGACAEGTPTKVKPEVVAAHCKKVRPAQDEYRTTWLASARAFFKANVPGGLPTTVVYPFAGGDLATALTVFPDAEEITTLALEPAGDPRALGRLTEAQVKRSLGVIETELSSLYRANFSKTMNMIGAMRGGQLPTQLVFSLSALHIHGYEPVSLRYFKLDAKGEIVYLTTVDVQKLDKLKDIGARNRGFANVELKFRKPGAKREQTYRHIMANLDNEHLAAWPAPRKHLEKKGRVAAMTKAASYLLSFGDFSTIRKYLIDHVEWMVSDTTGVPPSYGTASGFEYETWGDWKSSNMAAGNGAVRATWRSLFAAQPRRELKFRFGYPNGVGDGHLVFMRRAAKPTPAPAKAK
jgi:hypothetical protein